MSSLPEDVYHEILLRVPAKSTFTCKCVCKTWLSIISNPNFIEQHLNVTTQRNNNLLMLRGTRDEYDDVIFSLGCDSLVSDEIKDDVVELHYPYKPVSNIEFIGSCNGLVCIWSLYWRFFCIWNPATKEFKKLPKSAVGCDEIHYVSLYVFGYDCKNDDYKLINVVCGTLVDVYSLKSNSWKSDQTMPYRFFRGRSGVLVNGAWHWVGRKRDNGDSELISLDISDERFQELPLSKELPFKNNEDLYRRMDVGVLEERLCIILNLGVGFQVWMMHEYGVRESWTKCYNISHDKIDSERGLWLLCSLMNSEILLLSGETLVSYDPKDGSAREHNLNGVKDFCDYVDYCESLVSLDSGTYVGVDDKEEEDDEEAFWKEEEYWRGRGWRGRGRRL